MNGSRQEVGFGRGKMKRTSDRKDKENGKKGGKNNDWQKESKEGKEVIKGISKVCVSVPKEK